MVRLTQLLDFKTFKLMNDDALERGYYRNDPRIFTPGMGYYQPFYYDALNELPNSMYVMIKKEQKGKIGFLSEYYWRDWADKRPPLAIVCPNGETWEVDRKASNGPGWQITGEWPNLTATPSIVTTGYHGFLRDGIFTEDIEGRGPIGIVRELPPLRTKED